jgi:xanthine/CO dehydrogenase XdhC/CoxF family maturation factor
MQTLQIYSGNLYGGVERTLATIAGARGDSRREFAACAATCSASASASTTSGGCACAGRGR